MSMKRDRADRLKDAYDRTPEERAAETVKFVKSLHFSVPLWKLHEVNDRRPCPKCTKRRQFYCYDCLAVAHPETHPPAPVLPLNVHVVFHPGEHRSKSTSLAAATISPRIRIYEYPEVPEALNTETTLVLYPAPDAVLIDDVREELHKYTDVVFVDSTWQQSKRIARDDRVTRYRKVRIHQHVSLFWRFQNNDPSYLATVEAIYYCLREVQGNLNKQRALQAAAAAAAAETVDDTTASTSLLARAPDSFYGGEVDDLLFYYVHQYIKIQMAYTAQSAQSAQPGSGGEAAADAQQASATRADADDEQRNAQQHTKTFTTRHFGGYIVEGAAWNELVKRPDSAAPPS